MSVGGGFSQQLSFCKQGDVLFIGYKRTVGVYIVKDFIGYKEYIGGIYSKRKQPHKMNPYYWYIHLDSLFILPTLGLYFCRKKSQLPTLCKIIIKYTYNYIQIQSGA